MDNTEGTFRPLFERDGSQQEWYRDGEQPVVSCIMQEKAGFFDFNFGAILTYKQM
jgi:hypothetical protein